MPQRSIAVFLWADLILECAWATQHVTAASAIQKQATLVEIQADGGLEEVDEKENEQDLEVRSTGSRRRKPRVTPQAARQATIAALRSRVAREEERIEVLQNSRKKGQETISQLEKDGEEDLIRQADSLKKAEAEGRDGKGRRWSQKMKTLKGQRTAIIKTLIEKEDDEEAEKGWWQRKAEQRAKVAWKALQQRVRRNKQCQRRITSGSCKSSARCVWYPQRRGCFIKCATLKELGPCTEAGCGWAMEGTKSFCSACEHFKSNSKCNEHGSARNRGCTWTGSKCEASISIVFGSAFNADAQGIRYRPEDAHSELCDKSGRHCGPCDQKEKCWHGDSSKSLSIKVPRKSPSGIRTVSTWMNCTNGARWSVQVDKLSNADIDVFADGKKVELIGGSVVMPQTRGIHHLKVALRITSKKKKAEASITVKANGLDSYVDQCMGRKYCLAQLDVQKEAAFKLRQSSETQMQCMVGKIPTTQVSLDTECDLWKQCLLDRGHTADDLTQMLGAAILKTEASFEEEHEAGNATQNGADCLDPVSADPEELECECLHTCEGLVGSGKRECIRNVFCDDCGVCEYWKQGRCTQTQIKRCAAGEESRRREKHAILLHGAKETSAAATGHMLDDVLTGKCSQ